MPEGALEAPQTQPGSEQQQQASSPAASPPPQPAPSPAGAAESASSASPGQSSTPQTTDEYANLVNLVGQVQPHLAQRFTDGKALVAHLLMAERRAAELQQMTPYVQQYMQHAGRFQEFLKAEQSRQQQQQQERKSWWNAPEFDPSWRDAVYQDPTTGELKVRPGYPPDIIQRLTSATQHQRSFLDKFSFDPVNTIRPGIEEIVREIVTPLLQQGLGSYQEKTYADQFVQQNAEWLFEQDPLSGGRRLSEWGQRFQGYVREAEQLGIRDVDGQRRYAMTTIQRDAALMKLNQGGGTAAPQAPANPNQAAKEQFLARAASSATRQPNQSAPETPPSTGNKRTNFSRRLLENMRREGLINSEVTIPG